MARDRKTDECRQLWGPASASAGALAERSRMNEWMISPASDINSTSTSLTINVTVARSTLGIC